MDERLENKLKSRWSKLEDRAVQLTAMMDELESLEEDYEGVYVRSSSAYMILQKELELTGNEQHFIESLWKK